jgi:hypothetical protein
VFPSSGSRRSGLAASQQRPQRRELNTPPPSVGQRIVDGLPGALAWLSIIAMVIGAIFTPWIVFTIAAVCSGYMALRTVLAAYANWVGLRRIRQWENTDWQERYRRQRRAHSLQWDSIWHVVIIPNYKEDIGVLRQTLARLAESPMAGRILPVLAMEARDPQAASTAVQLQHEFKESFPRVVTTLHPRGLSGELACKSANEAWAARHVKRVLLSELRLDIEQVVVTTIDADTLLHVRYFEALTCLYANAKNRHSTLWQAPIRYHSNVWKVNPALSIVQAYGSGWELAYLSGWWWQAMPISSYSISMKLIDEVGYWDPDVIADDWHMFIKSYFHRRGKFTLAPLYLPFSAYTVTGTTMLEAFRNRYRQMVRHAWGAKEIGYTAHQMIVKPSLPHRASRVFMRVAHDHLMAGAGWVIMTLGAQLPVFLYPQLFLENLATPEVLLAQISVATIALVGIYFWMVDMRLRPPRPTPWTAREVLATAASFVALPMLVLVLIALPVLEAQTRLMLGIPLQFRVARKV